MTGRAVPEWIGATPDSAVPPRVRLRIWDRENGICHPKHLGIKPKGRGFQSKFKRKMDGTVVLRSAE